MWETHKQLIKMTAQERDREDTESGVSYTGTSRSPEGWQAVTGRKGQLRASQVGRAAYANIEDI